MLRTSPLLRALPNSSSRAAVNGSRVVVASWSAPSQRICSQQQTRQAHAISNPTLANIEKRWEAMPPQEQAELWMALRDRMKVDWNEMTMQEKKAAYWVAFGPHGPRALPPADENTKIFVRVIACLVAAGVIFGASRHFARDPPSTLNKEWQEAQNEYLKENNIEPISGVSSEGYKGKGMVQSPPKAKEA